MLQITLPLENPKGSKQQSKTHIMQVTEEELNSIAINISYTKTYQLNLSKKENPASPANYKNLKQFHKLNSWDYI